MEAFLVSLCMAILERVLVKGTEAFSHYLALKDAIDKANKYNQVVQKPTSREERKRAEDDALS